jgi:SAM-dependent methyltransferase
VTGEWDFDPVGYLEMVRAEIVRYDELQTTLADATVDGAERRRILDLGSGTGVTAANVLARHPGATLTGIDGSEHMLQHARRLVPAATFTVGRLEDPLPDATFDLVVSAFAVHHLVAAAKADLFRRIAGVLDEGGRFVLCDVVVATGEVAQPVPLEEGVDVPDTVADQVAWLEDAGLRPSVVFAENDVAVIAADRIARGR